jgi:hypothetical protein
MIDNVRNVIAKLDIQRVDRPFGKQMAKKMERGVNLIWNGMRKLPYGLSEITKCIARFIILLYREPKFGYEGNYLPLMGRIVEVGRSGADLTYGRCFVSGLDMLEKVRRNIYGLIREEDREICKDNPVALLQLVNKPNYLFRFDGFKTLFLNDAIPSQVLRHIESILLFISIHIL